MKPVRVTLALGLSIGLSLIASGAMAQAALVTPEELKGVLPQSLGNYVLRENLAAGNSKSALTEAAVAYAQRGTDINVRIHIADLINNPELYDRFIATAGIVQANVSRVVEDFVKRGGKDVTVSEAVGDWGQKTLRGLKIDTLTSQSVGSRALRGSATATAPTPAELIDQWSVFGKGEVVRRFGDVPIGDLVSGSGAAIALEHDAYGLGIDFAGTATRAKDNGRYFFLDPNAIGQFAVGLTEERYPDGAYAKLFSGSSADVAGWEIYQPQGKYGVLLLGVGGRFAVMVEGVGIDNMTTLSAAFDAIALDRLKELSSR